MLLEQKPKTLDEVMSIIKKGEGLLGELMEDWPKLAADNMFSGAQDMMASAKKQTDLGLSAQMSFDAVKLAAQITIDRTGEYLQQNREKLNGEFQGFHERLMEYKLDSKKISASRGCKRLCREIATAILKKQSIKPKITPEQEFRERYNSLSDLSGFKQDRDAVELFKMQLEYLKQLSADFPKNMEEILSYTKVLEHQKDVMKSFWCH